MFKSLLLLLPPAFEGDDHRRLTSVKRSLTPPLHRYKVQLLGPAGLGEGGLHFLLEHDVGEVLVVLRHLILDPVALDAVD